MKKPKAGEIWVAKRLPFTDGPEVLSIAEVISAGGNSVNYNIYYKDDKIIYGIIRGIRENVFNFTGSYEFNERLTAEKIIKDIIE